MDQYYKEREYLCKYIQSLFEVNTIFVSKVVHGNHNNQVHLYLTKVINEGLATQGEEVVFIDLNGEIPVGTNVYSKKSIQLVRQCISRERLESAINKLT